MTVRKILEDLTFSGCQGEETISGRTMPQKEWKKEVDKALSSLAEEVGRLKKVNVKNQDHANQAYNWAINDVIKMMRGEV